MTTNEQAIALDPDAQAVADQLAAVLPNGLSGLGVAGVREFGRQSDAQIPTGPEVHSVVDKFVSGPHGDIPVRLYRPQSDNPLPVLLYIHGGGWTFGTLEGGVDHLCRSIAHDTGTAVVSVDYRLAPDHKFPVPVDESAAVLSWLRRQAAALGVDATRIAIGGDSAGGNISAAITHLDRGSDTPLAAQVLLYPATEYAVERASWVDNAEAPVLTPRDTLWFWDQYLRSAKDRIDPRATPANAESFRDLPPALVVVAGHDPLRDDGLHYAELLDESGTPVHVVRLDGAFHGFMTMPGLRAQARGVEEICGFLQGVFAL
ncbi:alpha/beta hydrolase [Gordonia terrae]|uniref:Alpha/beta hydrolase n=2 Tax=Gordonia terrae TaxID=2055 RepID=A0AAD0NWQ4_9ACTN|nr:alpha/beta hydrolase [Gordonia terrae]VTR09553.1 esterase/lipase [Clostridioides difficile]ANY22171.1 esterase [Gordonia terrae]AWO82913.1 alpha/beta hydrolase [Gordonia terrae]VTS28979.1 Lipase 2 [Gordonia terrae]GAB46369.1 putative esterase [Gordonia terrae NBRC 100016]